MMFSRLWPNFVDQPLGPKSGVFGLVLFGLLLGCTPKQQGTSPSPEQEKTAALVQKGRVIYQTQCIACHHADPKKPGTLGPDVFKASKELLEARILRAEYPANYVPKRETHTMVALPHLKNDLDAIHAYLNAESN
ncbi:MAG: cytochrome c [Candidatus Melainabacteria bacterium]|nr:cytochrome c [Candidatus Melainabacteria bacterium]